MMVTVIVTVPKSTAVGTIVVIRRSDRWPVSDARGSASTDASHVPESSEAWRRYPFDLIPGDEQFRFPAAEACHEDCQSDTWFLAGELTATRSGRRFAFLAIFNKNRPGGSIVADFYTMSLFDLDDGAYATFTDYDMPPANMAPGATPKLSTSTDHLDLAFESRAGRATWKSRRDERGLLVPFTYDVSFVGVDASAAAMGLRLVVSPTRAPAPVGASVYNGRFECLGQPETFSYFHTGMAMVGELTWGGVSEEVSGTAGHVDRQWFPLYVGGGGTGGEQRAISHEWRTIHLDNGVDFVGWRQFDRNRRNALQPFTGATVTYPEPDRVSECVEDVEVDTTSYVRWPVSVRQLVRAPVDARWVPDRHHLSSATLELELTGEPLVPVPAHALPIEYMEGPFRFHGTMRGTPVSGFGISERSLALYRDWELVGVLATAAEHLEPRSEELVSMVRALGPVVDAGQRHDALALLEETIRPLLDEVPPASRAHVDQVVDDLAVALSSVDLPT